MNGSTSRTRYSPYPNCRFTSPSSSQSRRKSPSRYRYYNRDVNFNRFTSRSGHTDFRNQRRNSGSPHYFPHIQNRCSSFCRTSSCLAKANSCSESLTLCIDFCQDHVQELYLQPEGLLLLSNQIHLKIKTFTLKVFQSRGTNLLSICLPLK